MELANLALALLVLAATGLQAYDSLLELRRQEAAATFNTIDSMRNEVPRRHPIQRRRHRRLLDELLAESPVERAQYWQIYRPLISWSLLATAGAVATFLSAVALAT